MTRKTDVVLEKVEPDKLGLLGYCPHDPDRHPHNCRHCLADRIRDLQDLNSSLCDRIAKQSELLSQRAEKVTGGHPVYLGLLDEMKALHLKKAADYGSDSDPLQNLRGAAEVGIEPWLGTWLRARDKVKRIDQYCRKRTLANEGLEDSLMDLAAYCLLALTLRRE